MRRIPRAAGREGGEVQYRDDWLEFYHRPETEKEFPLRNRQVPRCVWSCSTGPVCSLLFYLLLSPFPTNVPSSPFLSQVRQRAADVKEALDLVTLLHEGGAVHNMMDGNFDFKQFQVNCNTRPK